MCIEDKYDYDMIDKKKRERMLPQAMCYVLNVIKRLLCLCYGIVIRNW